MSIKAMTSVWEFEGFDPYERLVMLALADHANDEGVCYPSISRLKKRTGMTDRGIQNVVKRLCEKGHLSVEYSAGRGGTNVYKMTVEPRTECAPEPHSPPEPDAPPPRTRCTSPPNPMTFTPEPGSDEPLRTVKEPSGKKEAREVRAILCQCASSDAAGSFIRFRSRIRKPLTPTAAKRQARQLQQISDAGFDPDDALGMAEEKGWQSVQADWYFNAKGSTNDNRTHQQSAEVPAHRPDPALEQIARLAGLGKT